MKSATFKIALSVALLTLIVGGWQDGGAQELPLNVQGVIKDFEFPIRDDKGNLQYTVKGLEARPMPDGRYELIDAVATIYASGGEIDSVVKMEKCILDPNTKEIQTDNKVYFERPNVTITGIGMDGSFAPDGDGLILKDKVRVEIGDIQKGVAIIENNE